MTNPSGGSQLLNPEEVLRQVGIKPGWRVADLGSGAVGHFIFPAAQIVGKEGVVYAVDIRKIVLQGIKNRARIEGLDNIKAVWANLEIVKSTGILNDSVDAAMIINVLFQNNKKEEILTEGARIVKPGGILAVIDWKVGKSIIGPEQDSRVNPEEIIKICQKLGLKVEKEFEPDSFHFGLLFKK